MQGVKIGVFRGAEFISGGFRTKNLVFGPLLAVLVIFKKNSCPEHIHWNARQRNMPNEALEL